MENDTSLRRRIFDIIRLDNKGERKSKDFDIAVMVAIILNILMMVLETFWQLERFHPIFRAVELATVILFIAEYLLSIFTADYLFPDVSRGRAALQFIFSYDGIVELCSILPFFFLSGFVVFRMLRVVRILHLFRINSNLDSFNVIKSVLVDKRNQIISSVFIVLVLMMAASMFMYSAEHEAQPDEFPNALSGLWWAMQTLLTLGYGDVVPVTIAGKILGTIISFLGVGVVAIPTGIISAGFVERYHEMSVSADASDFSLHKVVVDIDSAWIGMTAAEVKEKFGFTILIARRGTASIIPNDEYHVQMGDVLAIYND